MKKIAIYGTGKTAAWYVEHHDFQGEELAAFIETKKKTTSFLGKPLLSVTDSLDAFDEIHVANRFPETVSALLERDIPRNKIVICNKILYNNYKSGGAVLKYNKTEAEAYEAYVRETEHPGNYVLMSAMSKPLSTEFLLLENADARVEELGIGTGQYMLKTVDYCRFATLELLTREIEKRHVPGAVAELGVFRGDFAKYINRLLPNRKFYLFDTFEGFDRKDIDTELHGQYSKQSWFDASLDYFSNTNVDKVLEKMKHREQCIVRKGYFPDTIPKEEVAYAFVSLDCDLYQPMLEGLRYFYPRLQKGGYLMIHDYNGDTEGNLTGVRKAVQDYEMESGEFLHKVPISDACGSLVICK